MGAWWRIWGMEDNVLYWWTNPTFITFIELIQPIEMIDLSYENKSLPQNIILENAPTTCVCESLPYNIYIKYLKEPYSIFYI